MKKFLSLVLALVMTMSLVTISAGAKDFTDDSKLTYKEAVDVVSELDIVDGYKDGSFGPTATLTRGAAAKIICNMILGPTTAEALPTAVAPFKDVAAKSTFAGYIAYCSQQGIINGYADGTFRPTGTLNGYAFMKMLLGAVGYDSEIEGFTGANWSINVAKLALGIGLDDDNDKFVGANAVTREEACLYVFNALQATMVDYQNKTTVNVNGAQVVIGQSKAENVAQGSYDNNMKKDDLQFAERYFSKLVKSEGSDDFARPATTWRYKGAKVGTYANTADVTYSKNVELGDIYSDLNMSEKDAAKVYVNGAEKTDVAVSKGNSVKIASDNANKGLVGDGSTVEVFYDEDKNDVTICVIDTYVGEIKSVEKATKAKGDYVVVSAFSNVTLADAEFETTGFEEDDVVLFTYSATAKEIKSVVAAESVEGTLSKITSGKSITLGDTVYKNAKEIAYENGKEDDLTTKSDYTVYLDTYGNVIYVKEQEFVSTDYAFVLNAEDAASKDFTSDRAKLVLADGSLKTVDTDDGYSKLKGQIVTYKQNDAKEYVLRAVKTTQTNNGSEGFSMSKSTAKIMLNKTDYVYANSKSVFVVYDGKDYKSYTGISNAPGITPKSGKSVIISYYTRNSNMVAFAFIDATNADITSSSKDVIYLAGQESVSKLITDRDNNKYYEYNAVVNGKITTLNVLETATGLNAGKGVNGVYQNPSYDSDDFVKSASAVSGTLTAHTYSNGTVKVSGDYTIGFYTSDKHTTTDRYTVASDCKIYMVDGDGKITSADLKDIKTDTNDSAIVVEEDGELSYIFVQQNSEDKVETPTVVTGDKVVLNASTFTYTYAKDVPSIVTVKNAVVASLADYNMTWSTGDSIKATAKAGVDYVATIGGIEFDVVVVAKA